MRRFSFFTMILVVFGVLALAGVAAAQSDESILIPIGGGYPDTFPGFVEAAVPYAETLDTDRFYILMMPMSFTYDVDVLTAGDLLDNSFAIERRRRQLERACVDVVTERALDLECQVVVPPLYTRDAAESEYALDYFADDLAAVYFVGGDQTFAMLILNGTPVEAALTEAFENGVVMGGNSAGAAIMSRSMIGGYTGDFGVVDQLREGIVDLWTEDDRRGLPFGLQSMIVEQHFFQFGRPGRLLNAIVQPGMPPVGLGVDGFTGAVVVDDVVVRSVIGAYGVGVIDVETYDAVGTANYDNAGLLSARNALFHTLAPGEYSYDIAARTHSLAAAPADVVRDYSGVALPEGAGTLILGSNLRSVGLENNPVIARFLELAGGEDANILVLSTGYAGLPDAVGAFEDYAGALGSTRVRVQTLLTRMALPDLSQFTGIIVVAGDQSLVTADELRPVAEALLAGTPVLADDAAAPVFGVSYAAHPAIDYDNDDGDIIEAHDQGSYVAGGTTIVDGLGLVGANFEPQLIDNNRWGRLLSVAYNDSATLAFGLTEGSAVEVTPDGATVLGTNGVVAFDFSMATLALGDNDVLVVANGLMDAFAPGEAIAE